MLDVSSIKKFDIIIDDNTYLTLVHSIEILPKNTYYYLIIFNNSNILFRINKKISFRSLEREKLYRMLSDSKIEFEATYYNNFMKKRDELILKEKIDNLINHV